MTPTVLIVDDSLTVRMDLAEAFSGAGFTTLMSGSAGEARTILAERAVDVIILDLRLPDGDGGELLKELRSRSTGTMPAILMLSSEAEVKDRIHGLQIGADEYVGKPYDAGYVVAKARELLRMRRAAGSPAAGSILVIDDSLTFREALGDALVASGHTVIVASSGEEGLRIAGDQRPALIIVDGILPGIDGATVIRRVRLDAALRSVPCILLTASEERGAELKALDAGADAFARKDDDMTIILAKVMAIIRQAAEGKPVEPTASLLGPKRILAVDDSQTYLHELSDALRVEGYDMVSAHSGDEALELLAVQPADCILLDLRMPGLSGIETCRRIKSAPVVRDIPLIILTASDDRESMVQGLGVGADDYIQKSGSFDILKARVRAQIRRKQFEDENRHIREQLLRRELEAVESRAAHQLAESRAALVEELQRKNQELEAFSYTVSHDLRAPLRSIDGFSLMLMEECAPRLDEEGIGYLKRVRAAAQRMGELIDDLLALSRVSCVEIARQSINLSVIAQSVAAELQRREPQRVVEVVIAEGLVAEADSRLVRILLENLMGNAWKFIARSAGARIEVGVQRQDGASAFFVRDNGVGFDEARAADRMFQPFQRLHSDKDFAGTGVGLATVRRIVERHGGRIWARSTIGHGATFHFTLPDAIR
jgi:two-component system NtrC family sensor kinase